MAKGYAERQELAGPRGGTHYSYRPIDPTAQDRLARGEAVPFGPGACRCGHAKVWHRHRPTTRPCERCDCARYTPPD